MNIDVTSGFENFILKNIANNNQTCDINKPMITINIHAPNGKVRKFSVTVDTKLKEFK